MAFKEVQELQRSVKQSYESVKRNQIRIRDATQYLHETQTMNNTVKTEITRCQNSSREEK